MKKRYLKIAWCFAYLRWKENAEVRWDGRSLQIGYKFNKMFVVCSTGTTPFRTIKYIGTLSSCQEAYKELTMGGD